MMSRRWEHNIAVGWCRFGNCSVQIRVVTRDGDGVED
jgi:hypothetical protein